jgi:4-amino-4-deoxy-L-arabinose transferase-like glycosyltransferase
VIELELQVTSYLTAILYYFFGTAEWVGRIVPILFSILSTIFLYRLVKFHVDERLALFTAFAYSVLPLHVFFTRVPMPESVMLFLSIGSLFYFSRYIRDNERKDLILAICFTCLAYVSKPAALHLIIPMAFAAGMRYRMKIIYKKDIWAFFIITTAIGVAYWVGMHRLADVRMFTYEVGTDKWGNMQVWSDGAFYSTIFKRFHTVIFTLPGFIILIAGLILDRKRWFFYAWLGSVIAYIFIIAKGNQIHTYYQMPIVPIGAYFIGVTLYELFKFKWVRVIPFALCGFLLYLSVDVTRPLYEIYARSSYEAAKKLLEIDSSDYLVLSVPHRKDLMPEMLYYANRKGWVEWFDQLTMNKIENYRKRGARYMVMTEPYYLEKNRRFVEEYLNTKEGYTGKDYIIVKL